MPDETKTIEELEHDIWPDPDPNDTGLVKTCHALRKKPLRDFTPNDVRIMIGQGNNLGLMIPKALRILERDPLIEAHPGYPGNLLEVTLRLSTTRAFWDQNPVWMKRAVAIAHDAHAALESLNADDKQWDDTYVMTYEIKAILTNTIRQFLDRCDRE